MKYKLLRAFGVLAVVVTLLIPATTHAQSNALGVTPKLSYTIKPGQTFSDTLYVNNLNRNQALNLQLSLIDFSFSDETGAPKLYEAADAPQTPWSLKPYTTLPQFVKVEAAKSALIPFTIKLPANIGAGTYYSAVQFKAVTEGGQQNVNISASNTSLLFANVPGTVSELLSLQQFGVFNNGKFQSSLTKLPTTFAYRLKNSGNVAEQPAASIVIKNILGHVSAHIDNANPKGQLALIGQTRRFEVCYPKSNSDKDLIAGTNCQKLKLPPGRYTALLSVLYGQNGQAVRQISAVTNFWYLPLWFILLAVVVLVAAGWLIYFVVRRLRRRGHRRHR